MNMHTKIDTKRRLIPQGYTPADELVAIRTLLREGRATEASQRLDIWMDRHLDSWRAAPRSDD